MLARRAKDAPYFESLVSARLLELESTRLSGKFNTEVLDG